MTPSHELLCVFSGPRQQHVDPYGVISLIRSYDGGATWTEPQTVVNTPLDDRDPGILVTQSGTIIVSWFSVDASARIDYYRRYSPTYVEEWTRHNLKIPAQAKRDWEGNWTVRSEDGGRTWEAPVRCPVRAPHGPIEVLVPRKPYEAIEVAGGDGNIGSRLIFVWRQRQKLLCAESWDGARSWQVCGEISWPPKRRREASLDEGHVIEAKGTFSKDVYLLALWREERDAGIGDYLGRGKERVTLHRSESLDGGRTWNEPVAHKPAVYGFPPHLIRLTSGEVLITYGYRELPYGIRAKLWPMGDELILDDEGLSYDIGYPSTIELTPGGDMLTVYYESDPVSHDAALRQIRWRLEA